MELPPASCTAVSMYLLSGKMATANTVKYMHAELSLFLRIEHTEVRHMGQAFRLGRYAIHFHLSGTVNGSYVRNCAIHHSFNRALTAHGIHNLLVEGNVAYDIMGHTYFVVSCLCNAPPPCVGNRQSLKL